MTTNTTGFSAQIRRTTIPTDRGDVAAVVKRDSAEVINRELTFYRSYSAPVSTWVPALLSGGIDHDDDTGFLVLEDVAPAEQLDVLPGCSDEQASAIVTILARDLRR